MKNFHYVLLLTVTSGLGSCVNASFLDETVTTTLDYNTIFSDSTYTEGFLSEIYREIGFTTKPDRFSIDHWGWREVFGGLQTSCDEAEFRTTSKVTTDVQFATGTVNPVIINDDAWRKCYENIRRVNRFFQGIEIAPLQDSRKKRLKAEARFLRAWYYFNLMQHYGGVPLIGDVVYAEDDKMKDVRDTYADCVDYVVKECNTAFNDLAYKPMGKDYGRVGGGACQALIARTKLYAASPLYNGNREMSDGVCPPELIGYPDYSADRWKEAMDAAYAVLSSGQYTLYEQDKDPNSRVDEPDPGHGFYAIFMGAGDKYVPNAYSGTIWEEINENGDKRESWFQPPSRGVSQSAGFIYQNLVDAFPMKNGKSIVGNPDYNPQNPYENRDPRLRNTVVYDQVSLQDRSDMPSPVNIYLNADGSPSGQDAVYRGTPTGYYINKMVNRYLAAVTVHGGPQGRPLIRYADIALGYAEAMNEYKMHGSGESSIVPADEETYEVLKKIRKRGGIEAGEDGMYGLKEDMTRLDMRDAIRLERRIELAIEGYRFWDVRRWKIAEQTENEMMKGMEIRSNAGVKKYTTFDVRKRVFRQAMYFWPIPYGETTKLPNLIQNPYYNL